MSTESLACTYAALLLHEAGVPTTAENISAAVKAAGVEVRPTLPIVFARFLEKKPVDTLMAAAAAMAPTATEAPAAAAGGAAPAAGKAAPKKEEKVEEEGDDDMGFGLFD